MSKNTSDSATPAVLLKRAGRMNTVRLSIVSVIAAADCVLMDILAGDGSSANVAELLVVSGLCGLAILVVLVLEERYLSKPTYLSISEYWQRIATRDALTGLHNRLAFMQQLNARLVNNSGATRFAILFIDLNKFKAINDTHGHGAGDTVLVVTARRIKKTVGKDDIVARLGGDEFAVILTNANVKTAQEMADALDLVLRQPMQVGGIMLGVSASVGMHMNTGGATDAEDLMHEADMAMYRRKATERWRSNISIAGGRVRAVKRAGKS